MMWLVPDNGCVEKISQCNKDGPNLHVVKPGGRRRSALALKTRMKVQQGGVLNSIK